MTSTSPAPARDILNAHEAAAYLNASRQTLANWRVQRRGPRFIRLGRSIKYRAVDLDAFLNARVVETADTAAAAD